MLNAQLLFDALNDLLAAGWGHLADAANPQRLGRGCKHVEIEGGLFVRVRCPQCGDHSIHRGDRDNRLQPDFLDALEPTALADGRVGARFSEKCPRPF